MLMMPRPQVKKGSGERPVVRTGHACTSIREKVFVFGGASADGALMNDVWVFDQDSSSWSTVNCYGSLPSARKGGSLLRRGASWAGIGGSLLGRHWCISAAL